MRGVSVADLKKAKRLWLSGMNDAEVGAEMSWKPTKAWTIRQYELRLPANRNWRDGKKGPRDEKKSPKTS